MKLTLVIKHLLPTVDALITATLHVIPFATVHLATFCVTTVWFVKKNPSVKRDTSCRQTIKKLALTLMNARSNRMFVLMVVVKIYMVRIVVIVILVINFQMIIGRVLTSMNVKFHHAHIVVEISLEAFNVFVLTDKFLSIIMVTLVASPICVNLTTVDAV
jgi:hypothetical protein